MEPKRELPIGYLFEWQYDNEEFNNQQLVKAAIRHGWDQGGVGDGDDANFYLIHLAPSGYRVGREDGLYGVWEDEEDDGDYDRELHPGDSTEEDDPYHNG